MNSTRNARDDFLWNAVDCLTLCVYVGNVVAVLTQANMRPRTRQLRLISQEIALEFSCAGWVDTVAARVMVQPMTFSTLLSVLKEATRVLPRLKLCHAR